MSAYVTQTDIQGQIPQTDFIGAFDDLNSGNANPVAVASLIQAASAKVDGKLSSVFAVPFNPVPQPVFDATLTIACYMIYRRVKASGEKNPFDDDYKDTMKFLERIAADDGVGLDQSVTRAVSPVVIDSECMSVCGTMA